MKNIILFLFLASGLLAQAGGAGQVSVFGPKSGPSSGGTVTSVAETFTGGIISVSGSPITTSGTFSLTVAGTSGGVPYFSDATHWTSSSLLTANALMVGGGAGVAPSTPSATTTLASSGVLTLPGSTIRTPATITITANAGPWVITNGLSLATNNAATTLTPSGDGTNGQFALVNLINSHATVAQPFTFDTVTDFTITAAANRTTSVLLMSTGAGSGWLPYGGSPSLLDAAADTTPASTKLIGTWDATSGVLSKSTIAQIATTVRTSIVEKIATFSLDGAGSAITTTTVPGTSTCDGPYTLTGWSISATGATGTNTIKIWNVATGTAIPTISNVINTNGVSLTTGTHVYSTTITDFTDTTYAAQDQFRCAVTAVDGTATDLTVTLYGTRL